LAYERYAEQQYNSLIYPRENLLGDLLEILVIHSMIKRGIICQSSIFTNIILSVIIEMCLRLEDTQKSPSENTGNDDSHGESNDKPSNLGTAKNQNIDGRDVNILIVSQILLDIYIYIRYTIVDITYIDN